MKFFLQMLLILVIIGAGISLFAYYISNSDKTSSSGVAMGKTTTVNNNIGKGSHNLTIENKTISNNSDYNWIFGKWQTITAELGLMTVVVNKDNVICYGANTKQFVGTYQIEDNVMYCFFETENIKFPLDAKNQTIDFGKGYFAKKVQQ